MTKDLVYKPVLLTSLAAPPGCGLMASLPTPHPASCIFFFPLSEMDTKVDYLHSAEFKM